MSDRGIDYADGGISLNNVHYPDPEAIKRMHICWRDDPSADACIGVPIDLTINPGLDEQ